MSHGGDIYKYSKILGCKPNEIIDFSSNINAYIPQEEFCVTSKTIVPYADFRYKNLKKTIASVYGVKTSQILLTNGASSAIELLMRALKPKRAYLYTPIYSEYISAAKQAKKAIFPISRLEDFELPIEPESLVVFVNPATPDGTYYEDIEEMLAEWIKKKCTIIVDESFLEFEKLPSVREQINSYDKLYIIQSFSKFYGCAGVRIGAVFGSKKALKKLSVPIWNISSLDVAFLEQRLTDDAFKEASWQFHTTQKQELEEILEQCGIFEQIIPSDTNFFLVKSERATALFNHLLEHNILVRRCFTFDGLDNTFLRFAVKDKEAHSKLKEALGAFA